MATYKTPGVYVEEISTLPPSVAEVSTAIPAFIGYTEKGPEVARINTLLEYEELFGRAKPSSFSVVTRIDPNTNLKVVEQVSRNGKSSNIPEFLMYYCVSLYFKNGGGSCYIVSIGNYSDTPQKEDFIKGLGLLEKEDEPTLILLTDAVNLQSPADYHELCHESLAQCNKMGDRFAILDVLDGKNVDEFRNDIGTDYLKYGAAYCPYLQTTLNYQYQEPEISIQQKPGPAGTGEVAGHTWEYTAGENGIVVQYTGSEGDTPKVQITKGDAADPVEFSVDVENQRLTISDVSGKTGAEVAAAWAEWKESNDANGFDITVNGSGTDEVAFTGATVKSLEKQAQVSVDDTTAKSLESIKSTQTALYNQIKSALSAERVVLPPSAAVAGVYARVDRERGVWKAPANVSLLAVIGPVAKITHEEQERLNIDPTAGKSINAIRDFTGKGTLIWGARTLAGNDNEWRYISVRRLFNMIEESTKKSTAFAVFEPNDATTWLKVKGMIEAYLYGLWEQGALAGPTPEAAYFVNVGLGKTMTAQDVLEGRMNVEIGIAAVRPAEFIILRFTHKLQEA